MSRPAKAALSLSTTTSWPIVGAGHPRSSGWLSARTSDGGRRRCSTRRAAWDNERPRRSPRDGRNDFASTRLGRFDLRADGYSTGGACSDARPHGRRRALTPSRRSRASCRGVGRGLIGRSPGGGRGRGWWSPPARRVKEYVEAGRAETPSEPSSPWPGRRPATCSPTPTDPSRAWPPAEGVRRCSRQGGGLGRGASDRACVVWRSSIAPVLAERRSEDRDAFFAVGEVADTVQNLWERLNTYAAQLPRQVRWQAELLVAELAEEHDAPGLLGTAGQAVREVVAAERRAVLEDVNGQRQQTPRVPDCGARSRSWRPFARSGSRPSRRWKHFEAGPSTRRGSPAGRRGPRAVATGRAARHPDVLGRDPRGARRSAHGRASWLMVSSVDLVSRLFASLWERAAALCDRTAASRGHDVRPGRRVAR